MSRRNPRAAWFGEGWATCPQMVYRLDLPEPLLELLRSEQRHAAWRELERIGSTIGWSGRQVLWRASDADVAEATLEIAFEYSAQYNRLGALRFATAAVEQAKDPRTLDLARQMRLAWLWRWTGDPGSMQELMGMPEPSLAAREEIARHLSEQGRFEEAIRILQEIVGAGFWDASIVLGNVLSEAGRATEALEAYDVGLEHGDIRCPFNAARTLIDGGRHAEARLMLRRGASLGEPRAVGWLRTDARRRKRERRRRG